MKYTETDPRLPVWLNNLLNRAPLLLDSEKIKPGAMILWRCRDPSTGAWCGLTGRLGRSEYDSHLFWNACLFLRVLLPFCICFQLRWSGSTKQKALFQLVFGWKLNGRFAITCRVQSDTTSAAGVLSPNTDQASGWDCGGH